MIPSIIMTIISLLPTMKNIPPGAPTPTGPDRWEAGKPRNWAIDSRSADAEVLLIIKTIVIVVILTIVIMIKNYDKVNRCLARYSSRATTTNRPTNRALNKPAWPGPN